MGLSTTIVVPCFNEAERLPVEVFRRFVRSQPDISFLFVNDGSRDGTLPVLEGLCSEIPRQLTFCSLPSNVGKGEAVRQGILQAGADRPEYVGYWDADLAAPLEAIPQFREVLDRHPELDLVLGVRMPLLGHQIRRQKARHRLGRLFARAAAWTLGFSPYDTQCGAKLFRATPENLALFAEPFTARWIFDVELLARLSLRQEHAEARDFIYEYPLDEWRDVAGSKLKGRDFAQAVFQLAAIYWRYMRPRRHAAR